MAVKLSGGYAVLERDYDDRYTDRNGTQTPNAKGVYQTANKYGENGKVTRESYFDAEGCAIANNEGYTIEEKRITKTEN